MNALDRRAFLKLSALTGGGLILGVYGKFADGLFAAEVMEASAAIPAGFAPNAFLRIAPDGRVFIVAHSPEIGQGVRTSLPMIVAEELDVAWEQVTVELVPLNPIYGPQAAAGSQTVGRHFTPLRQAGATARAMLIAAATQTWGVPAAECHSDRGAIHHALSARSLTYGQLVALAATLPVPPAGEAPLKDPKDFKLLGRRIGGVDNPKIVTGQPLFGIDQRQPGMVHAVYIKCPVFGGKPISANLDEIKALPGVRDAFIVEGTSELTGLLPGIAIVADTTWASFSARRKLKVEWDEGPTRTDSWAGFVTQAHALSSQPGAQRVRKDGDIAAVFASAPHVVEATYTYPFISHANLEPQNCIAHFHDDRLEIWAPTQAPASAQELVSQTFGVSADRIVIHLIRAGGAFGRRLAHDYILETVAIAQRVSAPVKLTWTREDDLRQGHYRGGGFHFLKGAVGSDGRLAAWKNHFVTFGPTAKRWGAGGWLSPDEFPARFIADYLHEATILPSNVPLGFWRAPGSNVFAWVIQSFLDELAHAAGRDPLAFHLELLGTETKRPTKGGPPYAAGRMREVVRAAAEKGDWGKPLPRGQGRGLAFHFSHRGYFAIVTEVTVTPDGVLTVDRVVVVGDVGSIIVNPSGGENQVVGSVMDGLSAAWLQELNLENGRIVESNFHQYRLLRIDQAPKVEPHFLLTDNPPTGLGEPALPPLAPAVCNAVFAATGKRIRTLPIARNDLSWS